MSYITWTETLSDGDNYKASNITNLKNDITSVVNGNISNTNISSNAELEESKILFDTSAGHDHDGTDSKTVAINNLSDVDITSIADNQLLRYNSSTSKWENDNETSLSSVFTTFGGDGSDGSQTISSDTNFSTVDDSNRAGIAQYTSLTIDATKTLTVDTGWAIIGVSGTLTLNGTVDADGQGESGGSNANSNHGGAGARANGIADVTSSAGTSRIGTSLSSTSFATPDATIGIQQFPIEFCLSGAGGGGAGGNDGGGNDSGGAGGGAGGYGGIGGAAVGGDAVAAEATPANKIKYLTAGSTGDNTSNTRGYSHMLPMLIRYRGAGGGAGGNNTTGGGGKGGGVIYIECDTVTFGGGGILTAAGADGDAGAANRGPGGGGGGGVIIVRAKTINNVGSVTVSVAAGSGGADPGGGTEGAGGDGAAGFKDIVEVN